MFALQLAGGYVVLTSVRFGRLGIDRDAVQTQFNASARLR